ncbi:response regulator [Sphingomonas xinjiangensis]|uniref:DNA-binding response OmpR family regulator n=1 Tax=Sphingomonas xinjiangensis TaxID=643568 RepID=A0A840YRE8_9SPHN|nr:response regulator [Sphingomonas xinjiangensis]MBB5712092.1 DNA-binding response OmpR family regulator [Sphingomonas xinjiangensis]
MLDLRGRTVLVVEDEIMVAMLTEDLLSEVGCDVIVALRCSDGLSLARQGSFDVAVLDVNLGGGDTSHSIARELAAKGKPFLFATGYGKAGIQPEFADRCVIQKPYPAHVLLEAVGHLLTDARH